MRPLDVFSGLLELTIWLFLFRCMCLNRLEKGQILALCKDEKTLREFILSVAIEDGEDREVSSSRKVVRR